MEERREPPCLTTNPTSATLTIQTTSKITPTTSCSFLFVMEETVGLSRAAGDAARVSVDAAIEFLPFVWLMPLAPFYSPRAGSGPGIGKNRDLTFGRWGIANGFG